VLGFRPHLDNSYERQRPNRYALLLWGTDAIERPDVGLFCCCPLRHVGTKVMSKYQNASFAPYPSEARGWTQILARYRAPSPARSIIELVCTAGPLILLWFLMWTTLDLGYWICLLLAVPAAGFLVRLFMIQHDWRLLPSFSRKRLGRTCDRCAHAHALRLLATHSRYSPLDFGQS
jgi:hypothetical protein